jgi:hypothetical protein
MRSSRWILFLLIVAACSAPLTEPPPLVVAEWEDVTLDLVAFEEEYMAFASAAPMRDGLDARRDYAIAMLERRIIADIGRMMALDTLREVKLDIRRKREAALRRSWLEKIAESKLRIPDEADILDAFRRSNTRLNLEQIYATTREEILTYERRLSDGESFESIAVESMQKMGVPDSSFRMGWVGFEMMDEAPETVAMSLKLAGEVSKPVASLRGWHIFRLLEREETFHADGTTYNNARENLAFKVYHRRLEEITVPFTDSLMTSHSLQTYMDRLRQAWAEIAPLVPRTTAYMDLVAMNQGFLELKPTSLARDTPLALVNDKPFTFGQFIDRLPDLPLEMLRPNLRGALELAIRDSVLAARAEQSGLAATPEVQLAEKMATNTALYFATLRAVADTVNVDRLSNQWYERWKDTRYMSSITSDFRYYVFADSSIAWDVIRSYQQSSDWNTALGQYGDAWTMKEGSRTDPSKSGLPEHTLPLESERGNRILSGPWPRDNEWALIEATARTYTIKPYEEVESDVRQTMVERLPEIVHQSLIPKHYRRENVTIDDQLLMSILRF